MVTMIRSDLDFILAQIKIAEADAEGKDLIAEGILPNSEVPWGLRRVDGSNNNLTPGQGGYGAAGEPFPRETPPSYTEGTGGLALGAPFTANGLPDGTPINFGFPGVPPGFIPLSAAGQTTSPNGTSLVGLQPNYFVQNQYGTPLPNNNPDPRGVQPGDVTDADPRVISNLIVDQTVNNPAALFKALQDAGLSNTAAFNLLPQIDLAVQFLILAREGSNAGLVQSAENNLRNLLETNGVVLEESTTGDILKATLYIGNVAADEGLSAPFNGWMTLFGQFFDHGLDLVAKGGFGTVYIPLQPDDPLYDHSPGARTNFMVVTRATLGEDGQPVNLVTPFVDQNQTYTSHASHQVFLREYDREGDVTEATGRLLDGNAKSGGGLATWADVKAQAIEMLGIKLSNHDIHNVPLLSTDPYGKFIPGPNGYAQVVVEVTQTVLNDQGQPVPAKSNVLIEGRAGGLDIHALTIDDLPDSFAGATVTGISVVPTGVAFLDDIAHTANPGAGEVADGDVATPAIDDVPADDAVGLSDASGAPVNNTGFYDDELLDAHYITGDGRGNENIGLTAVHHVFHSEHNRQVDLIQDLLVTEGGNDIAFLREWLNSDIDQTTIDDINELSGIARTNAIKALDWNGERIFQAAKFPTEMQYQHLVFEEFARKVQPAVNVFNDYDGTLDPAILAEFAHTVYRFGHSMLTETVDRYTSDWQTVGSGGDVGEAQIGLIEAFLNPLEFAASGVTAEQAAGVIAQGMTRQRGNEIDEFVTEALRNNLVGLPLDLAAINIARGRETGVPSLNKAREDFFSKSGDTQIKPYESWFEFMQNLKNPASVINFIAAYGNHESITNADGYEAKRQAATDLVLGGGAVSEEDRLDFLNGRSGHADRGGLDKVDFWIGGLAEKKLIFGGMLGSTFNFVFEAQLEALQNGDRFYYLSRLANLNLTAQLENNKFSEMIHRNTTATHLPGDAFARPDFFLEADIRKQFNADIGVGIDPTTDQVEIDPFLNGASGGGTNGVVLRTDANGDSIAERLEYTGAEHVVLGGTEGNDWLIGGKGDDTLWGDGGDDRLEGGDGNDFIFGGDGNDIITDLFGVDEIRSGAGDDVVSAGRGLKLIITDTGNDWVWGGVDDDEVLAGQGDDFVNGGDGADFLIGGEGNDWLESGRENGLMLGDNGDLVQGLPIKRSVDSRIVGHDVLLATGGNADFDAETGDDIMVGGLGTDRFFGQFGFDWATYKFDNFGIEADMNNRLFAPPLLPASPGAILDRYAQTEGLSGSNESDILRGDDVADLAGGGEGAIVDGLDHALYDANVNLIIGLKDLLEGIDEVGEVRFSAGNILLGGDKSDIIEGRGGNDIIDGDAWLDVYIVHSSGEQHETMADFQQRVLAGTIPVSELSIVREIKDLTGKSVIDIAEYSGRREEYDISNMDEDGFVTVTHLVLDANGIPIAGQVGADGVDKLKNIERLLFSDQTIKITEHENSIATGVPVITETAGTLFAALPATTATDADGVLSPIVFYWQVELVPGSGVFTNINQIVADEFAPVTGPSFTPTAAEDGLALRVLARFKDGEGVFETVVSAPTIPVGGIGAIVIPDPAVELGLDLGGVDVDGAPLPDGTIGILEDSGVFTFTEDDLLAGIRAANPGVGLSLAAIGGEPGVTIRQIDGDPVPGTLTFANGVFTFTPAGDFFGGVTFEFNLQPAVVPPGVELELGAEATLEVIGVNDAPIAPTVTLQDVPAGPENTITFSIADLFGDTPTDANGRPIDIDGDRLEIDPALVTASVGTLADIGNDTFTLTIPAGTPIQTVTIDYTITDGLVDVVTSASFALRDFDPTGGGLTDLGPTRTQAVTVNTASIVDPNGIASAFSIQWQSAPDNGGVPGAWINIAGATGASFTPGTAHVGRFLQAVVTYTDGAGSVETVTATASRPTGNVFSGVNVGVNANDTINGTAGDDIIRGNGGADTLFGNAGDDEILGGLGDDTIDGGIGDDTITWNVNHGRDVVNGGVGGTDTFIVNGNAANETFRIYSNRDDADGDASNGIVSSAAAAGLVSTSEIVITRGVGNTHSIIAELSEIEEYVINTGAGTNVVEVVGDFSQTSLSPNTITVDGTKGKTKVDATKLMSPHHIAFHTQGNDDTLVGGRVQDEVFGTAANGSAPVSQFFFTGRDVAELKNLVAGRPSEYADDGASGIRDLEGTGNNVANPNSGAADQNFIRLTDARFGANGDVNPIHAGLDPRNISNILGDQEATLAKNGAGANIFFMAFGQYVDHGLDFLPKDDTRPKLEIGTTDPLDNPADLTRGKISGYDADGNPEYHNQASPFVDQNQAYGSTEVVGQLLRESAPGGKVGAHLLKGATDPSNADFALLPTLREALKHHWDAGTKFNDPAKGISNVTLKSYYPGLIDASGNFNAAVVAQLNANFLGSGYQLVGDANFAINILDHYVAGDLRANENYTLTSIHTVWARNHNYHVDRLLASGFDGTAEQLFQAAKIVNEAEYQRVVFTEFTDYLLGGLKGGGSHGHDEYNPNATAQISHEFAAAAYRFGHSQIGDTITILDENGNPKSVNLFDAFLNPTDDPEAFLLTPAQLAQFGYSPQPGFEQLGVSDIIGGIVRQEAEEVDFNVVDAVRNDLVRIRADLFAFNVARGWDVGLGTLNQVRAGLLASTDKYVSEAVELSDEDLSPYTSWDDFQNRNGLSNGVIEQFKAAYPDLVLQTPGEIAAFLAANPDITLVNGNTVQGIDRVDLWVGGLAEKHINGGTVGSTFWVILHEQFDRLQEADRFYYLDRVGDADFYEALKELEFSDIVARNTGLTGLPKDIFSATDKPDDDDEASETGDGTEDDADDDTASGSDGDDVATGDDSDDGVSSGDEDSSTNDDEAEDDDSVDDEAEDDDDEDSTSGAPPTGGGSGTGTGTSTSSFVVYLGAAVASETALGGTGNDVLSGGDGDDHLFGYGGDDFLIGGDGDDYLDGGDGADILNGGDGSDVIKGGAGDDEVDGGAGRDIIKTGTGNDVIFVRNNDAGDVIDAGEELGDSDTLDMSAISANITVYLSAHGSGSAAAGGMTHSFKGVENVVTGDGDDVIMASSDVNELEGGAGRDTFVFSTVNTGGGEDVIKDLRFDQGDTIDLTPLFSSLALGDVTFTNADFSASGRVRLTSDDVGESTLVEISTDGDQDVELAIRILGRPDLDQKDFGIA